MGHAGKHVEKGEYLFLAGSDENLYSHYRNQLEIPQTTENQST